MAKTIKAKKVKGLDIVIGDMIVNHFKKKFAKKKDEKAKDVKLSQPKPVRSKVKASKAAAAPEATVEPQVVQPAADTPKTERERVPYKRPNIGGGEIKRTKESGEYIHPLYKFGKLFNHEGEPHHGTVSYVATFSAGGEPLVQPLDDNGQNVGKSFQADPKKLSEK